ncbi:hypothetical protein ACQ4M3_06910 [Leptolyngbya sp. AN03gr2]|uniref:hypothetical protein n=1 Tax=unclassified Leptolyngbya TaxID=2650499 RepID=UPI003D3219F7
MVERPIKKSERQEISAADPTATSSDQPSTSEGAALPDGMKSTSPRPVKKGDAPRSSERSNEKRGKKNDRGGKKSEKVDAPPVNPALMRGPRPPKPSAALPEPEAPAETESSEAESES